MVCESLITQSKIFLCLGGVVTKTRSFGVLTSFISVTEGKLNYDYYISEETGRIELKMTVYNKELFIMINNLGGDIMRRN